jgi:hypothetical protein
MSFVSPQVYKFASAFHLSCARERVKRRFLIPDISAGNITLRNALFWVVT